MLPVKYRIKFTKLGSLRFISHLDLLRSMNSALSRSALPVFYSEGFNPHPKISFGMPLPLGCQSICEYMDIKMANELSSAIIKESLDRATAPEMKILEVYPAESKLSDIAYAEYEITVRGEFDISPLTAAECVISKKSKSGEKQVDIIPLIKRISVNDNIITAALACDGEKYLSPEYICRVAGSEDYSILRRAAYLSDGVTPFR